MCSIMGYCSPSAVYEVFMRGFKEQSQGDRMRVKWLIPEKGILDFIDWRSWE